MNIYSFHTFDDNEDGNNQLIDEYIDDIMLYIVYQ